MDLKYDLLKHPNVSETADGGMEPYIHGEAKAAVNDSCRESFYAGKRNFTARRAFKKGEYVLLSESDIQEKLYEMEEDV